MHINIAPKKRQEFWLYFLLDAKSGLQLSLRKLKKILQFPQTFSLKFKNPLTTWISMYWFSKIWISVYTIVLCKETHKSFRS